MDAATFDIRVNADSVGVDSTADELNALVDKIRMSDTVATKFDGALAGVSARLKEASAASQLAAAALQTAEARYKELERAANKAAKEVEKATQAGKDTSALRSAADAATAAMHKQALAVDELKAKSVTAATAEKKLADSLKTLEKQQASTVAEIKKAPGAADKFGAALRGLGLGDKVEKFKHLKEGIGGLHAATLVTAGIFSVMSIAIAGAVFGFAALALAMNPGAMQRLAAAGHKLKDELKGLFSGLKFDKFLDALDDMVGMFDKGTSSGSALKLLIETILQPLFDSAETIGPFVKEMFKGMIYGALQVAIGVLKARNAFLAMFPPKVVDAVQQFREDTGGLKKGFDLGTDAAYLIAGAIALVTGALVLMAVAELAALWPILLVIAAIWLIYEAVENWGAIVDWMSGIWDDFVDGVSDAVDDIIDGIVDGIKDGAGAVWKAMKDLAGGAVDAFKGALGIKSPSKVFALQGSYTTQGYVEGIEDGQDHVDSALESMVTPPDGAGVGASAGASGGKGAKGGSGGLQIQTVNVYANSEAEGREAAKGFLAQLTDALEGVAVTIGGGEVPA